MWQTSLVGSRALTMPQRKCPCSAHRSLALSFSLMPLRPGLGFQLYSFLLSFFLSLLPPPSALKPRKSLCRSLVETSLIFLVVTRLRSNQSILVQSAVSPGLICYKSMTLFCYKHNRRSIPRQCLEHQTPCSHIEYHHFLHQFSQNYLL